MEKEIQHEQTMKPVKRVVPVINVILFAASILLYIFTVLAITNLLRVFRGEWIILLYFGLEMAVFVPSVVFTIKTARNLDRMKGLGFIVTSLILTIVPAVFGPVFFLLYSMTFID